MKKSYRFVCLLMALFILFAPFSSYEVHAASSKRYSLSEVSSEQFTSSEVLKAGLDTVLEEYPKAFTKNGEVCSKSHSSGEDNCLWFTPHQSYSKHNSKAIQCFGFANYVYETIFGEYWDFEQYFADNGTLGSTTSASKVRSEFERLGVAFGTICRSTSAGHSFVVLSYDEDGIWIIHANYAGSKYGGCNTSVYYYTWAGFADAYGKIAYIIIPASICDKCVYTEESFPFCTVCSHRLNTNDNIYASYSSLADTNEHFLPLDGMTTEEIIPVGTDLKITSIFDVNEVTWAKTEDGKFVKCESLQFGGYLPSMEVKDGVYPDEYIVSGKSFWLDGTVVSKNTVISLTVEILNDEGEVIDANTISPNKLKAPVEDADDLQFSKLTKGNYSFRLTATDLAEEGKVLVLSPFRVISSKTISKAYPDKIFRQYLKSEILLDEKIKDDDYIDLYDDILSEVTVISVPSMGIASLGEIERFISLTELQASDNHITFTDLSQNEKLSTVDLSHQTAVLNTKYDHSSQTLDAYSDGEKLFTYSRPDKFPKEETVTLPTGKEGVNLEIVFTVNADNEALCDATGDGVVNSEDLSLVLMNYSLKSNSHADVTFDGVVDSEDISRVITYYGSRIK